MRDEGLRKYFRETREEVDPARMRETIALCREIAGEQKKNTEERTTFLQYLSDIFRIEGAEIAALQACILLLSVLGISFFSDMLSLLPVFAPLFALGAMPVLYRGRMYGMSEMEAVTRASGAQIILAKLILAGAADLVCMTLLLCREMITQNARAQTGQVILYLLVPYLICMISVLWSLRKGGGESAKISMVFTLVSCLGWGTLARMCPWLYEASAMEIWFFLFLIFAVFFVKEIGFILKAGKEGKMYGAVN